MLLLAYFPPAGRSLHLLAVVSPGTRFSYSPPTTVQAGFLGARRLSCPQGTSSASPVLALATPSSLCCCQPRVEAGKLCLVCIAVVLRAATALMARAGEAANARVWWLGAIYSRSCAGVKMRTGRQFIDLVGRPCLSDLLIDGRRAGWAGFAVLCGLVERY